MRLPSLVIFFALLAALPATARPLPEADAASLAYESGLTYADAELLESYWHLADPWEAKVKFGRMVAGGKDGRARKALDQAHQATGAFGPQERDWVAVETTGGEADTAGMAAYLSSGFTYCDATLVASAWEIGVLQSKVLLGQKLQSFGQSFAQQSVDSLRADAVRRSHSCSYHDEGLSYEDAVRLSQQWGVAPAEAKALLETKLVNGVAGAYLPNRRSE